ncbi:MAG: aldo/keto reductase [Synechococcales cyanobacterium]
MPAPVAQRRFGRTDLSLSVLTLGTMRLGGIPSSRLAQLLDLAQDLGLNHLETAPAYGTAERQLGAVLADRRSRWFITSKLLPGLPDPRRTLETSLRHLQTDHLDLLAFHGLNTPEHLRWILDYGLPLAHRWQQEGLIHHIGFSTHAPLPLILEAIATQAFAFVNLHYHYLQPHNAPALAAATQQDMGVLIISPADKGGMLYQPSARLHTLCQPWHPLHFAYQFLLSHSAIHTLSLGATHPQEVITASQWCQTAWDPEGPRIQARLDQLLSQQRDCHQCHACLPCPEGIPIPEILRLRDLANVLEMTAFGQYRYNMLGQAGHWFPGVSGDHCTDCGDCLPRCPCDLDIPHLLRQAHQHLHQRPIRRLWE